MEGGGGELLENAPHFLDQRREVNNEKKKHADKAIRAASKRDEDDRG